MLLGLPKNRIWVLGLVVLSSSAMATAGYMWPPVPPAAKTTRRLSNGTASFWEARVWSLDCFRERQKVTLKLKVLTWLCFVKVGSLGVRDK